MLEIVGYFLAIIIGVVLGLMGGGGSILTVPVLVYFFGISAVEATAYSLFVVGISSLIGALNMGMQKLVDYKTTIVFGIPSVITVFLVRMYIIPLIPETLFDNDLIFLSRDSGILLLFALLMLVSAWAMIRKGKAASVERRNRKFNYPLILVDGVAVGFLTGLVGAGGGFLIIPALVILSKVPMNMAVGTSLAIITIKSLIGFTGDIPNMDINWGFLLAFSGLSILGIIIGTVLNKIIPGKKLKPIFGWFILAMAVTIIAAEWLT